jgi:hypothetical protein
MHSDTYELRQEVVLGRQRRRSVLLAFALTICAFAFAASSAAAANFTWSGAAAVGEGKWSNAANWEGGPVPSGSVGTLTFATLTSGACTAKPATATCYTSENDVSGLSAAELSVAIGGNTYIIYGKPITLGAGGLKATTSSVSGGSSCIEMPISLSSSQTWSVDGNEKFGELKVAELKGSSSWNVQLSHGGQLHFAGCNPTKAEVEVGPVKVTGTNPSAQPYQNGNIELPAGNLNSSNGNPVEIVDAALSYGGGEGSATRSVGPLSVAGGEIDVGGFGLVPAGAIAVAGSVTLDSATRVGLSINGTGTTAGSDYAQISATGAIKLESAALRLQTAGECHSLKVGDVYMLVTTPGTLTGTFAGVPDGTTVSVGCFGGTPPTVKINYTEHTVTATVQTAGSATEPPPLSVSPPVISGTAQQGQTLTEEHGMWEHGPTGFGYQWERCDISGNNCTAIAGATAQTYALTAADVGSTIRVAETATNAGGSSTPATSAATLVVQAAPSGGGGGGAGNSTSSSAQIASVLPKGGPMAAPVLAQRQSVSAVSGTVTIRLKGTSTFNPLSGSTSIPDGSEVDATNGRVLITVATPNGQTASAEVYGGRFRVHQDSSGVTHFTLTLPLTGCPRVALPHGSAAALARAGKRQSGPKSRHLWVSESGGKWGTNGRYVSTTVQGTTWLTLDECTKSEVKVTAGKVKVLDLVRRKTKMVAAGHSYVAKLSPQGRRK